MTRFKKIAALVLALALALTATPSLADKGPPKGSAPFTPVLGYNPGCQLFGVDGPIKELGVNEYEDRVYGYVRYCANDNGNGTVTVKIINYYTNGHLWDGDTVCSAHSWLTPEGRSVLQTKHRVGLNSRSERRLDDTFTLSKADFNNVSEWRWEFTPCPKKYDKQVGFCFQSTACDQYYPTDPQY